MTANRRRDKYAVIAAVLRQAAGIVRGAENALALLRELEQEEQVRKRRKR